MSYLDISNMTNSSSLTGRLSACAATEDPTLAKDPTTWVYANRYALCSAPGWDAAWASAVASENPDPGADPGVITDGMILSQVQALLSG